mmetsp:Transcript_15228/g.36887  ORF Transcript_15228/g.36887 Transcript_15228/m.36887 type:complete len:527 (-) Transcript_15228:45-1625(-)
MAHPLELAEPNVIDEELIRNCITTVEEISIAEDKKKEMKTETELHDIKAVSFSFQNILRIDNLNGLFSLVKLQLDNNIIEKIENIGHLVNLEWLDLSFNNIQTIQGLETLTKLTDLSLFNNRIEELKNLKTLQNLNCLSVGNNLIRDVVHAITYLRPFRNLKMLNMAGTPCHKDPEYHMRIVAHLRDIVYVDYRLVDPDKVQAAREQYQEDLFEILEEEKKQAEDEKKAEEQQHWHDTLSEANLSGVDTLLKVMLDEDPEQGKLHHLSFWLEIIDEIQHEFKGMSKDFIDGTLNANKAKYAEKGRFVDALRSSRQKSDGDSIALVGKFDLKKKKLMRQLEDLREDETIKKLRELQDLNTELNDDLLELGLRQMEADDQIISDFERRYGDLVNAFVEAAQNGFFAKVRDLENAFHTRAVTMATDELEHFAAGQLEDVTDEAQIFLGDKDIVFASLNASHDAHLGIIDGLEDQIVTKERKTYNTLVAEARAESHARDRKRITEIATVTARNNKEIVELIQSEQEGWNR